MAKRGRKHKPILDIEEQLDEALMKYISGIPLTLEDAAILIWQKEGRKTPKPMSKTRIKAIENSALLKLRRGLQKMGITKMDEVFNTAKHNYAKELTYNE